jgi:hypothetical protein
MVDTDRADTDEKPDCETIAGLTAEEPVARSLVVGLIPAFTHCRGGGNAQYIQIRQSRLYRSRFNCALAFGYI